MEFTGDFKTPSSTSEGDEGLVQCCQYPTWRNKNKDNSTIIEFVHIPVEKKENLIRNSGRIPASEGRKRSRNDNYYDQMTITESRQQPTVLYHDHLGAQYVGIQQPHNVVTTQNPLLPVKRKDSAMSTDCSSSSLSMASTTSMPSVSTSTLSAGFKYKTHLLSRYSSELEAENRLLKQIIRKPWNESFDLKFCVKVKCYSLHCYAFIDEIQGIFTQSANNIRKRRGLSIKFSAFFYEVYARCCQSKD